MCESLFFNKVAGLRPIFVHICKYLYLSVRKTDNVPSQLLLICQRSHSNSYNWAHDVRLYINDGMMYNSPYMLYTCMY